MTADSRTHSAITYPRSWFRIARHDELPKPGVLPLRYFDQDLVLSRLEDGSLRLFEAHCPHLGAHLGYGGRIEGETLRCPYHGWLFDGSGTCVGIPYSDKKVPKVKLKSFPVREINGLILMYFDGHGRSPQWEIPVVSELTNGQWTPLKSVRRWQVKTTLNDYFSNSVDVAHLANLHSQTFESATSHGIRCNGPVLVHRMDQVYNLSSLFAGRLMSRADGGAETSYYGTGYDVTFYWTQSRPKLEMMTIFTGTPIDPDTLDIEIYYSVKKALGPFNGLFAHLLKSDVAETFEQDIPILENKTNLPRPIFFEEDGPIRQSLRWAEQFYEA
ncbi:MAG: Rieske 2Fe-2S domain-containing protein [Cyanobacteria bacterium P01_H01_bin.15]